MGRDIGEKGIEGLHGLLLLVIQHSEYHVGWALLNKELEEVSLLRIGEGRRERGSAEGSFHALCGMLIRARWTQFTVLPPFLFP